MTEESTSYSNSDNYDMIKYDENGARVYVAEEPSMCCEEDDIYVEENAFYDEILGVSVDQRRFSPNPQVYFWSIN